MKKQYLVISFLMILFLLNSCFEDSSPQYVPRKVIAYLNADTGFDEMLEYVYSFPGLSIKRTDGLNYITDLPEDSVEALRSAMREKDYFWYYTTTAGFFDGALKGAVNFYDMSKEDKDDCLAFFEHHHMLRDTTNTFLDCLSLEVPRGLELLWVEILSQDNFFWIVDVDWLGSYNTLAPIESQ